MALQMHRALLAEFGGASGIRDEGLLESALETPQASFGGVYLYPSIYDQASAYLFHLIQNHPFVDGNKRVAYACMRVFLEVNGHRLTGSQDDKFELVMAVAEGSMSKHEVAGRLAGMIKPR